MKLKIVFLLSLACLCLSSAKKKRFVPPGTVQIAETFFVDEAEITNFSWREYEVWVKNKYGHHSQEHIAALPDTTVWRDKSAYNEPYVNYYYRHEAYKDYPVVGISYEQALAFCHWRTQRVKEFWIIHNKTEIRLEYRLPTREEWEFLCGNTFAIFAGGGWDKEKKRALANFVREEGDTTGVAGFMNDNADVTAPVYAYRKNKFGLYNCVGNVAEMLAEKGICKGGSWRHRLEDCRIGKDLPYSAPTAWLGFRCVAVLEKAAAL